MTQGEHISWKRVSVEAAAVVVSILLAFAIDAAWDARIERVEATRTLEALLSELEGNRDLIGSNLQIHDSIASAAIRLLDISRGRAAPPENDLELVRQLVGPVINALLRIRTTNLVSGTGSALLASGDIGLIGSPDISNRVAGLPGLVEDALEDETNQRESADRLYTPYVLEHLPETFLIDINNTFPGAMEPDEQWAQAIASNIRSVLGSDELEGLLGLRISQEGAAIASLRRLHAAHVELIELIRASLGTQMGQPGSA